MRGWYQCNDHSAHLRRKCSADDCPHPLSPCPTCIAIPPYGRSAPYKLQWFQCRNGPAHQRQICTIDTCQEKTVPCSRCDPPTRQVFVMQRALGLSSLLQPIANKIGRLASGSATHWAVMVAGEVSDPLPALLNVSLIWPRTKTPGG